MFLIVGLGNPGEKYQKTRHNVGYMVLDAVAKKYEFSEFRFDKKANAFGAEGFLDDEKMLLVKPQTFMNNSGTAVKFLYTRYEIQNTKYIIIIHDDIDLPLGKIRISIGRGSAGHKGVESIMKALGTKDFTRIRVGIHPEKGKPEDVESFVLRKFTKEEQKILDPVIENARDAIETILKKETKQIKVQEKN